MLWKGPVIRLSWSKLRIYDAAICRIYSCLWDGGFLLLVAMILSKRNETALDSRCIEVKLYPSKNKIMEDIMNVSSTIFIVRYCTNVNIN